MTCLVVATTNINVCVINVYCILCKVSFLMSEPNNKSASWDTGDLQVGIFPYYVIRHGITNSIF